MTSTQGDLLIGLVQSLLSYVVVVKQIGIITMVGVTVGFLTLFALNRPRSG